MINLSPYVEIQRILVDWMFRQVDRGNHRRLRRLLSRYENRTSLTPRDRKMVTSEIHLPLNERWEEEAIIETIRNQIDVSSKVLTIRNLLGLPLYPERAVGYEEYARRRGSGSNRLRTPNVSQPSALKKGDVLATGCRVLSEPREGGNGSVLLHLSGTSGQRGAWIDVPARIPIALWDSIAPESLMD